MKSIQKVRNKKLQNIDTVITSFIMKSESNDNSDAEEMAQFEIFSFDKSMKMDSNSNLFRQIDEHPSIESQKNIKKDGFNSTNENTQEIDSDKKIQSDQKTDLNFEREFQEFYIAKKARNFTLQQFIEYLNKKINGFKNKKITKDIIKAFYKQFEIHFHFGSLSRVEKRSKIKIYERLFQNSELVIYAIEMKPDIFLNPMLFYIRAKEVNRKKYNQKK